MGRHDVHRIQPLTLYIGLILLQFTLRILQNVRTGRSGSVFLRGRWSCESDGRTILVCTKLLIPLSPNLKVLSSTSITLWYPRHKLGYRFGLVHILSTFLSLVTGLISWLISLFNGYKGLATYSWIFVRVLCHPCRPSNWATVTLDCRGYHCLCSRYRCPPCRSWRAFYR